MVHIRKVLNYPGLFPFLNPVIKVTGIITDQFIFSLILTTFLKKLFIGELFVI